MMLKNCRTIRQTRRAFNRTTRQERGLLVKGATGLLQRKLSRNLPCIVRDPAGRNLGAGYREGYLHPTKGIRLGSMPAEFRGAV